MLHIFFDDKPWFAPKRYGLGTGLPIMWKGWALLLSYVGAAIGMALSFGKEGLYWEIGFALITLLFIYIAWKKTDGGWRWRWGDDDAPPKRHDKNRRSRNRKTGNKRAK